MSSSPRSELGRLAARGLVNRYFEHLELGEFTAAIEVAQDLLRHGRHTEIERLVDNEGLSALLEALGTWGKDRRAEVMMVVAMLGETDRSERRAQNGRRRAPRPSANGCWR